MVSVMVFCLFEVSVRISTVQLGYRISQQFVFFLSFLKVVSGRLLFLKILETFRKLSMTFVRFEKPKP